MRLPSLYKGFARCDVATPFGDLQAGVEVLVGHEVHRWVSGGGGGASGQGAPGFAGARITHAAMVGGVGVEGVN